jgi:predicted DNA-binding transcriptional regulator AlpA
MMKRATAAAYCDLSLAEFEREVTAERLPLPVNMGREGRWSRAALDEAIERIAGERRADWRAGSRLYG